VTIWLDNHLSPALARWIEASFKVPCRAIRDLGLARAADRVVFEAAREAADVFITKDRDFAELSARLGPPPAIVLLTLGNTSTAHLIGILEVALPKALGLAAAGESLVEIGG
jgi:predicted nuclease of predicted toxin-antitoxin system